MKRLFSKKKSKQIKTVLFLNILVSISPISFAQKKKTFLEKISEGLESVNTQNGNDNSGKSFKFGGKTIRGSWDDYSAGALRGWPSLSPKNHYYTINIDKAVEFLEAESSGEVIANLTSSSGKHIWHQGMPRSNKILEPGKYFLSVAGERYTRPNYEIRFFGPVSNIEKVEFDHFIIDNQSFDEEGGGGFYAKHLSPRNLLYRFEIDRDQYFDIDVESDGVAIDLDVISPNGKQMQVGSTASKGQVYSVDKTPSKGIYTILVSTREVNARGRFKIEGVGNFIKRPEKVEFKKEVISDSWNREEKHIYEIDFEAGSQEIIVRTIDGNLNLNLLDQYKGYVEARRDLHDPGLQNLAFSVKQSDKHFLEIISDKKSAENYELIIFGQFNTVKRIFPKGSNPLKTLKDSESYTLVNSEKVLVKGRILNNMNGNFPDDLRIIFEDISSKKQVAEALADRASGTYEIELPTGRKYSAYIASSNYLASSEFIDLSAKSITKMVEYVVNPLTLNTINIGATISLNNIFFETGKYSLLPDSFLELDRISEFLNINPSLVVEIAGHTDNVGNDASNLSLSRERANAVLNYLLSKGIGKTRIIAKGYGKNRPISINSTESGKAQNRRVEFIIKEI